MDKKSLISLAESISKERGTAKYFEFASNYLMNSRKNNIQSTSDFFKMLESCKSTTDKTTVRHAFGVRGKGKDNINTWIGNILHNQSLKKLSFNELHYVMAIATRYAKIYNLDPPER